MSISNGLHHHHRDDAATDGEDDDNQSAAAGDAYYHPISASDDGSAPNSDSEDLAAGIHEAASPVRPNGAAFVDLQSTSVFFLDAQTGRMSTLDLNGDVRGGMEEEESDDGEAEEEEERVRQLEASISTAFREDERRRSAPLTPENAARVVDAMRGVAFRGALPAWADQVPEDQWVDRLRQLRGEGSSKS